MNETPVFCKTCGTNNAFHGPGEIRWKRDCPTCQETKALLIANRETWRAEKREFRKPRNLRRRLFAASEMLG